MARSRTAPTVLRAGLVEACEDERLFGVALTPRQRELLEQVEAGDLLHVWCIGRRGLKTTSAAIAALWTALLRPELREHVRRRERIYAVGVATNLRQARLFLAAARSIVEASPLLGPLVEQATEDELVFKNRATLAAFPCTSRGGRGWPIAALVMDEAAHHVDGDGNQAAASVYRSLAPSVAQFGDRARIIVASTPYGTDGWFADTYARAERGELPGAVAAHATTAEANPHISQSFLEAERARDPDAYQSEYDALFVAAGGQYLDRPRVDQAVCEPLELPAGEVVGPVAAVDLAFVHDLSALAIVGRDGGQRDRLRLVLSRAWTPDRAGGFTKLLDEIADLCQTHGVTRLYCDQHHATAAVEHLARRGLHATVVATTAASKSQMFASLKAKLYSGQLE